MLLMKTAVVCQMNSPAQITASAIKEHFHGLVYVERELNRGKVDKEEMWSPILKLWRLHCLTVNLAYTVTHNLIQINLI